MNVKLSDLIAALPEEAGSEDGLQEIFADLARRPVPVGSLHRLWTVGELSTQITLAYLAFWLRQWFADADTRKQQLMDTNLRVALKTIHRLGYLRGAMTKLGQTLGNLPEILPDQVVSTLDSLHAEAPPMHFSLLREMVRNELGGDPEDVFASFEKEAFAAASIGQVHRAQLKSGERVAVKIQYPGIARTIDADFRNLGALLFPLRLGKDWESLKAQFEEVHRMLKLEVDYVQEAENMRQARALFKPEEGIVVPQIYADYSTKRVLTTEYISGLHLEDFLATNPSQTLRNDFGTKMYVAWFHMYWAYISYADPHSGNYVFMHDGRLGLLDFGCVQRFGAEERELARLTEHFAESLDGLPDFMRRAAGATDADLANADYMSLVTESVEWMLEPLRREGPFDFGDPTHLQRGVGCWARLILKRYTRSHPMFVYYHRSVFGLKTLLLRLRAQVDVGAVFRQERPTG